MTEEPKCVGGNLDANGKDSPSALNWLALAKWGLIALLSSSAVGTIIFIVWPGPGFIFGFCCWGLVCAAGRKQLGRMERIAVAVVLPFTMWLFGLALEVGPRGDFSIALPVFLMFLVPIIVLELVGWGIGRLIF